MQVHALFLYSSVSQQKIKLSVKNNGLKLAFPVGAIVCPSIQ